MQHGQYGGLPQHPGLTGNYSAPMGYGAMPPPMATSSGRSAPPPPMGPTGGAGNVEAQSVERTARSIFVGNIPYEATEEKLKEMFETVGAVVSFRLVYDRESGKPKGYGFCEYQDQRTTISALRNLQNIEFNGRPLRIGPAAGEQNSAEAAMLSGPQVGPPVDSPYGDRCEPKDAPEAISRAVASLPPEQMYELMKQMKQCIQNNPNEARSMLLSNPQLAYALLQAQIVMKIVDPKVAIAMLNRSNEQIPPINLPPEGSLQSQDWSAAHLGASSTATAGYAVPGMVGHVQSNRIVQQPLPMQPVQMSGSLHNSGSHAGNMMSLGSLGVGSTEQEKAALIMQVLNLSDESIAQLPEDQRRSIMILKDQLAKSGQI